MLIRNRTLGGTYYFKQLFGQTAEFTANKKQAITGSKKILKEIVEKIRTGELSTHVTDTWGGFSLFKFNTTLADNSGREYLDS